MTAGYRRPTPAVKKRAKPQDYNLTKEIRDLERDIALHPSSLLTQPRQQPAMTRYCGAQPPAPQHKKPARRRRKRKVATKPEVVASRTSPGVVASRTSPGVVASRTSPDVVASRTSPGVVASHTSPGVVAPLTRPDAASPGRKSEVAPIQSQREIIDLTEED